MRGRPWARCTTQPRAMARWGTARPGSAARRLLLLMVVLVAAPPLILRLVSLSNGRYPENNHPRPTSPPHVAHRDTETKTAPTAAADKDHASAAGAEAHPANCRPCVASTAPTRLHPHPCLWSVCSLDPRPSRSPPVKVSSRFFPPLSLSLNQHQSTSSSIPKPHWIENLYPEKGFFAPDNVHLLRRAIFTSSPVPTLSFAAARVDLSLDRELSSSTSEGVCLPHNNTRLCFAPQQPPPPLHRCYITSLAGMRPPSSAAGSSSSSSSAAASVPILLGVHVATNFAEVLFQLLEPLLRAQTTALPLASSDPMLRLNARTMLVLPGTSAAFDHARFNMLWALLRRLLGLDAPASAALRPALLFLGDHPCVYFEHVVVLAHDVHRIYGLGDPVFNRDSSEYRSPSHWTDLARSWHSLRAVLLRGGPPSLTGLSTIPPPNRPVSDLRRNVLWVVRPTQTKTPSGDSRVYARSILNQQQAVQALEGAGFSVTTARLENMSLEQQLELVRCVAGWML